MFIMLLEFHRGGEWGVFLSSYRNMSGSLGKREMLWEHGPQASVPQLFLIFVETTDDTLFFKVHLTPKYFFA